MLGKPETGRPIPAEQMSAVALTRGKPFNATGFKQRRTMMSNLGWGVSNDSPILVAIGTSNTAAIVCEMLWSISVTRYFQDCTNNVAMTSESSEKTIKMLYNPRPSTKCSRTLSRSSSRPEDRVALPKAMPPIARKTIDQWKEWKSSWNK